MNRVQQHPSWDNRCHCRSCVEARQITTDPTLTAIRKGEGIGSEVITSDGHYEVIWNGGEGLSTHGLGSSLKLWDREESWDLDEDQRANTYHTRASTAGMARANSLTPERRREIAIAAGVARQAQRRADRERDARVRKEVAWIFAQAQRGR